MISDSIMLTYASALLMCTTRSVCLLFLLLYPFSLFFYSKTPMFSCFSFFFFLMMRRPPSSTLFPYPTLFRSDRAARCEWRGGRPRRGRWHLLQLRADLRRRLAAVRAPFDFRPHGRGCDSGDRVLEATPLARSPGAHGPAGLQGTDGSRHGVHRGGQARWRNRRRGRRRSGSKRLPREPDGAPQPEARPGA